MGAARVASDWPRVNVGMAVYNEEKFLRQAVESLLAQDYPNFDVTISDNASTDSTQDICMEYEARDPRVRYHRNETNVGATENFNIVFRLSSGGEYFMWAGGHDLWAPTYLSRCVEVLEAEKNVVLCTSTAQHISRDGEHLGRVRQIDTRGKGTFVRANLILWQVSTFILYSVIRTSALRRAQPLWTGTSGPDIQMGFELALFGPFAIVPELLYFMRDSRDERLRAVTRAESNALFLERLYGRKPISYKGFLRRRIELWHVMRAAQLPLSLRVALMGSALGTIVLKLYSQLPAMLRRPVRGMLEWRFRTRPN